MTGRKRLLMTAVALALAGCTTMLPDRSGTVVAHAEIVRADGANAGMVEALAPANGPVRLHGEFTGLPPGLHGLHLHAVGACEAPAFTTAGPHLNPSGHQHGKDNPAGSHLGDLPNLTVASNGTARLDVELALGAADVGQLLFDGDGTAIVVHAAADDYRTDPSGNSGARIACGVFGR